MAHELTTLVHGEAATQDAIRATQVLFGGSIDGISQAALADLATEVPNHQLPSGEFGSGLPLVDLLVKTELSPSKGQARKDIQGGGAYVNNQRWDDPQAVVTPESLLFDRFLLLRKGKRNYAAIVVGP